MTLEEWKAQVVKEYTAAGFTVKDHQGWPLVETPEDFEEKVRFLQFHCSLAVSVHLYKEGCLLVPLGISRP